MTLGQSEERGMSRKKKKAKPKITLHAPAVPLFPVGAPVRVKPGTRDPDYPDMPLGGWAGTVCEFDPGNNAPVYLVDWDDLTLKNAHPVYRNRCERDGLDFTNSWMGEEDLELDTGARPLMEQPTDLRPRPLNPTVQEDRIRAIFQLSSDDAWPLINDKNLRRYYDYLAANLTLPLTVQYVDLELGFPLTPDPKNSEPLKIVELLAPNEGESADGLFCVTVRGDERQEMPLSHLEPVRTDRAWQLLGDYAFWYWESDQESSSIQPSDEPAADDTPEWRWAVNTISRWGLCGAGAGAAVGAVAATMEYVLYSMVVAAVTLALVGYVAGTRFGYFYGKAQRIKGGPILGGIFGLLAGAAAGVAVGPLVIAYLGTVLGSIAGVIVGQILRRINRRLPGPLIVGIVGTLAGAIILAWTLNSEQTLTGLLYGIPAGAAAGAILALGFLAMLFLMDINREDP